MSLTSKILATLAVIVLVVFGIWWLAIRETPPPTQVETVPSQTETPITGEIQPLKTNTSGFFTKNPARPRGTNVSFAEIVVTTNAVMTDWDDRVTDILTDDSAVEDKARKMLELLPSFPEAGKIETAQHIANLLPDEDYEKFGKYLTDPKSPVGVQDIVLMDVLNRPSSIKLPLLLETARNPANAKAGEAREMLELYLEEDYGTDWKKWEDAAKKYLQENPD